MTNHKHTWKSCLFVAACLSLCPALLSCVDHEKRHIDGVHAFIVKTVPADGASRGTADAPLDFATEFAKAGSCPSGETCYNVKLSAYAVDIEGRFLKDYNGEVTLSARPGKVCVLDGSECDGSDVKIRFVNGIAGGFVFDGDNPRDIDVTKALDVGVRYAHGTTRIWVEDKDRVSKLDVPDGICLNHRDTEDGLYCEPSLATGVSEEYVFPEQTVKMIQYNPENKDGQSPINKDYGQIRAQKGHDIVVTNVVSTGFYITDLGDPNYNSMFIFTYSQPGRVEIGDRVCEVSGGIAEFTGMTQLQFPSWGIQNKERSTAEDTDPAPEDGDSGVGSCIDKETGQERPCTDEELAAMKAIVDCSDVYNDHPLSKEEKKAFAFIEPPEPLILSPEMLLLQAPSDGKTTGKKTNPIQTEALERLESSVVTLQNIRLSTEFIDCDDNGNSKIESNSDEADCRTECQNNSTRCTEISNLRAYDQWQAWTIDEEEHNPDNEAKISVASSALIANFDITADCISWVDPETNRQKMRCPERHLVRLTGNLKQVLPGCSGASSLLPCIASNFKPEMIMTVIEPRIKTDLIMDEAFNEMAKLRFDECVDDVRPGGCRDTCKDSADACTCDEFAQYRKTHPRDGFPTECPKE